MMMSRLFSLILVAALLLPISTSAEETSSTTTTSLKTQSIREQVKTKRDAAKTALEEVKTAREDQKLAKLKTYGLKLIDHRLDAISKQEDRLITGKCKEISPTIQAAITVGLTAVETNLNTQKTALNAATTASEAKVIIESIIKKNHVFIRTLPAVNGACAAQRLIKLIDGKLTDAITKLKAAGIDTAAIEAKMASAKTDASAACEIYLDILESPGADTNKTKMGEAKTLLQSVRKSLGDIKSDIGNVTGEYKKKTDDNSDSTAPTSN